MNTNKPITALDRLADALDQSSYVYGRNWKDAIAEPDWESATKCHDWRNHVPLLVCDCWQEMHNEGRMAVYLMACDIAHAEEWD